MSRDVAALEAAGLSMRYGGRRGDVLRDCSFRLPAGRVCALVGPNGAGKSTLLSLAAGLRRPTSGTIRVFGGAPGGSGRGRVAYVAQDRPLYPQLTVAETLRLGAELNPGRWDRETAEHFTYGNGPMRSGAKIRALSGGQRARVALALALGKRADLLLLDEPTAELDPLARQELMRHLLAHVADNGATLVLSSHVIAELENVCDSLLVLADGRMGLAGDTEALLGAHVRLTGKESDFSPHAVVERRTAGRGWTALVRPGGPIGDEWAVEQPSLEELVLAHLRNPATPSLLISDAEAARQETVA